MERVWHNFNKWEELPMWREVTASERESFLSAAIKFTGNHVAYGLAMRRVIFEWPISCEHNLTDTAQNRKAWLGHAACCLAINSPEYVTRHAWGFLSMQQQDAANQQAHNAILLWEKNYALKNQSLSKNMACERLPRNSRLRSATAGKGKPGSILSRNLPSDYAERQFSSQPWLCPTEVWSIYGNQKNRN